MDRIVFIGGGGHARVLIDLINISRAYEILGIVDAGLGKGTEVSGIHVLGDDELLPELYKKGVRHVCIGVGSIKDNGKRASIYKKAVALGFEVPALVHPKSVIAAGVKVFNGVQVMAGTIIQTNTELGENTIVNTGAIIEHDCQIGSHVHVCPGAVISGGCALDEGAFVGAGATIIQGVKIGRKAVIAAGAVVIEDVPAGKTVRGVPAK